MLPSSWLASIVVGSVFSGCSKSSSLSGSQLHPPSGVKSAPVAAVLLEEACDTPGGNSHECNI
eukprot:6666836-Alexandrium_andersonii.AAC.1